MTLNMRNALADAVLRSSKPSSRMFLATATMALAALAGSAQAASSAFTARWTDTLVNPTVIVDASFNFDPSDFDAVIGTDWWYGASKFSGMTVTVTGSATPAANGVFTQSSFNWLYLGNATTSPTPLAALTAPDVTFAVGASGVTLSPSDAGGGGRMQVGSGGAGGQEYVYFRFISPASVNAVPEPSSYAMSLAGLAVLGLLARGRRRQTRAV